MNEILTIEDINARFPSEWVLINDPQVDEQLHVLGGLVLWHSKDRDEVYQKVDELLPPPRRFTVWFTGPFPEECSTWWWRGFPDAISEGEEKNS
jgi:hypothetical protein